MWELQQICSWSINCLSFKGANLRRLLYLILQDPERYKSEVSEVFEKREIELFSFTQELLKLVDVLLKQDQIDLAEKAMSGGIELEKVIGLPILEDIGRAKFEENMVELLDKYDKSMANDFAKLMEEA